MGQGLDEFAVLGEFLQEDGAGGQLKVAIIEAGRHRAADQRKGGLAEQA